jgi:hypothetical protein
MNDTENIATIAYWLRQRIGYAKASAIVSMINEQLADVKRPSGKPKKEAAIKKFITMDNPEGATSTQIARKFRSIKQNERQAIIDYLLTKDDIEARTVINNTSGKKTTLFTKPHSLSWSEQRHKPKTIAQHRQQEQQAAILVFIRDNPEGVSATQIARKFRTVSAAQRQWMLSGLVAAGEIQRQQPTTSNFAKKAVIYKVQDVSQ